VGGDSAEAAGVEGGAHGGHGRARKNLREGYL
jgi:hypothetical protein